LHAFGAICATLFFTNLARLVRSKDILAFLRHIAQAFFVEGEPLASKALAQFCLNHKWLAQSMCDLIHLILQFFIVNKMSDESKVKPSLKEYHFLKLQKVLVSITIIVLGGHVES